MSRLSKEIETAFNLLEIIDALNENGTEINTKDGKTWHIKDVFNRKIIGTGKDVAEAINNARNNLISQNYIKE